MRQRRAGLTLQEAQERGWLALQEILGRLLPECSLSEPTFKLWRAREVISLGLDPAIGPRTGRRGGTESLWPPELVHFLRDACRLKEYVYVRGQRPRIPRGMEFTPQMAKAASHASLRVMLWILKYEYELAFIKESFVWTLLQFRESALRRGARIQHRLDREPGDEEEALHHLAFRHAQRLIDDGLVSADSGAGRLRPSSRPDLQTPPPGRQATALDILETWKRLFFGGLPDSEDRPYVGLDPAGVPVPAWWTIDSLVSDIRKASPDELEHIRQDARAILIPLLRTEQARRWFISNVESAEVADLPEVSRPILASLIGAFEEYLKREEFVARHLRHFPLFAVTLLGLRRHGTAEEVQILDAWLQEVQETLAPLNAMLETDEVRQILERRS